MRQRSAANVPGPGSGATGARRPARMSVVPLVAVSAGYFVTILDATILAVALPSIGAEFGARVAGLQWVVDAYTVALAGLLLPGGSLADRYGSRNAFMVALAGF